LKKEIYLSFITKFYLATLGIYAGVSEWSKEAGLGPAAVGLRGFEPHPPHQHVKT
jgi:hypothetical protein